MAQLPTPEFIRNCILNDRIVTYAKNLDDNINITGGLLKLVKTDAKEAVSAGRFFALDITYDDSADLIENLLAKYSTDPYRDPNTPYHAPWLFMVRIKASNKHAQVLISLCSFDAPYMIVGFYVENGALVVEDFVFNDKVSGRQQYWTTLSTNDQRNGVIRLVSARLFVFSLLNAPVNYDKPFEMVCPDPAIVKARARRQLAPLPSYQRVNFDRYVTFLQKLKVAPSLPQGGTHASPTPHLRRGHYRVYKNGLKIFIRDTAVKVPLEQREAFLSQRSHYQLRATDVLDALSSGSGS